MEIKLDLYKQILSTKFELLKLVKHPPRTVHSS